jgi:hypothetical protein
MALVYDELKPEDVDGLAMDKIPFPPSMNLAQKQELLIKRQNADNMLKDIQRRLEEYHLQFSLEYSNFIHVEREILKISDENVTKECFNWFFSTDKTDPTYFAIYQAIIKICESSSIGLQAMQEIRKLHWHVEVKDFPRAEWKPIHILANKEGSTVTVTIQRVLKCPSNYNGGLGPYPCLHKYDIAEALEQAL